MAITDPTQISGLTVWVRSDQGLFQDAGGTTPSTTNGQSVLRWNDRRSNGIYLSNPLAPSNVATLLKDGYATGVDAVRFANGVLKVDGLGTLNVNTSSIFVVHRRRSYTDIAVVNMFPTAGSLSGDFVLHEGRQRPCSLTLGANFESAIGSPFNQFVATGLVTSPTSGGRFALNNRLSDQLSGFSSTVEQGIGLGTMSGLTANQDVVEFVYFSRTLSTGERDDMMQYLVNRYSLTTPTRAWNVVFDGNSITHGTAGNFRPFTDKAAVDAGVSEWDYYNYGIDGAQTPTLTSRASTLAPSLYVSSVASRNVAVCWEGTNHLSANASSSAVQSAIQDHCTAWRSAGYRVVVGTLIDRSSLFSGGQTEGGYRSGMDTVNTWLRANWSSFADALADPALNANLGPDGSAQNTTYFADGTHPNLAGHALIAPYFTSAIIEASIGGGAGAGGSSSVSTRVTQTVSGGSVLAGSSVSVRVISGSASGGAVTNGTAGVYLSALQGSSGGSLGSGATNLQVRMFPGTSGGIATAGSASVTSTGSQSAGGGVVVAGAAVSPQDRPAGVVASGTASIGYRKILLPHIRTPSVGLLCDTVIGKSLITWRLVRSKNSRSAAYVPAVTVCNLKLYMK